MLALTFETALSRMCELDLLFTRAAMQTSGSVMWKTFRLRPYWRRILNLTAAQMAIISRQLMCEELKGCLRICGHQLLMHVLCAPVQRAHSAGKQHGHHLVFGACWLRQGLWHGVNGSKQLERR